MAVSEQTMQVAACDAPTCRVTRTATPGELVEGFHIAVGVVADGRVSEVTAFAHSEAHVGPAFRAVLRAAQGSGPDGEPGGLEGPQVPPRLDGEPDPDSGLHDDDLLPNDELVTGRA